MHKMYNKEKLQHEWFDAMKDLQKQKHEHIMEEIAALEKAGIKVYNRGEQA